jgi:hypothetical protein
MDPLILAPDAGRAIDEDVQAPIIGATAPNKKCNDSQAISEGDQAPVIMNNVGNGGMSCIVYGRVAWRSL